MKLNTVTRTALLALALSLALSPVLSGAEASVGPSDTPIDMTPAEQDYSPGLGDRMDAVSYTIGIGWLGSDTGLKINTTYDEALLIQQKVANITNGVHQMPYLIGQDKLRWGTAPYLYEETEPPLGDGTAGSGYRMYRDYVEASFENNADVSQILEPLLAGSNRDVYASPEDIIPESCYTHTADGKRKIGWQPNENDFWYLLSLWNLYDTGYAQKAWHRMVDNWGLRTHIYYDAMIPVPEGLYNNPNLTTEYGGAITNTEMEWDAVQYETAYAWENFAISSGQEYVYPKYKGLSVYGTVPYGNITDDDYLDLWQNSIMISTRGDAVKNLVWGSEVSGHDDAFQYNGKRMPKYEFLERMMEHNLQYLYMMERVPLSYTNNNKVYEVEFSGDLVSSYNKRTGNYTLVEDGGFVIADGNDRFIPQVGAGCKIYCFSTERKTRTWKLPAAWDGIKKADLYLLSFNEAPAYEKTVDITDGCITVDMASSKPYIIVPAGNTVTPTTANFNDLADGDNVTEYAGLAFDTAGNTGMKVYGANARGGFGSPSVRVDSADAEKVFTIDAGRGTILHGMKVGNIGGEGRVVLHSSNPKNPDVMISLPKTDQVYKFNTNWKYGETGEVSVKIECDGGAGNVLFDAFMYSEGKTLYGDANADGDINAKDVALMLKNAAGWDVTLDEAAADANADGEVNAKDVAAVMKRLAGWSE